MGADSSKFDSLYRALDSDGDGSLSADDIRQWVMDEVWIRNPIFEPKINGMRTPEELADGFARHLARAQHTQQQPSSATSSVSVKVSKADLVAYCKDLSADELLELASSVIDLPQLPSGAAPALGAHGTRPRAASSSGDLHSQYLWLLSSASPSVLSACLARRDAMLRRVFDVVLDSNGNGILEPDEVERWMAWEAQRSPHDSKSALKEPGGQYFATPTQRAAVWKTLTTRPVSGPVASPSAAPPALVSPKLEPVKRSTFSTITSLNPWKTSSVMNPPTPTAAPSTPTAPAPQIHTQQTNAPVRFDDVRRLFARWTIRELRIHFQERLLEEEDRARRRSARAMAKAAGAEAASSSSPESVSSPSPSSPSLSASPVPAAVFPPAVLLPFLPNPMTSDVQSVLARLAECGRKLESLSALSAQQSAANLEANACKRQLNAEVASIEASLLSLDQSRLIVSQSVDHAQADHKLIQAQIVEAKLKFDACQAKTKSVGSRYESCINDVSALQSDLEKAKLAAKLLSDELIYMQHLDRNGPAQQKALLTQIAKQEREVVAAENAWSDTKRIRASFERELVAIEQKIAEQQATRDRAAADSKAALEEEPIAVSEPASSDSRRASTDAGAMAGASSALASLTPPRSRSASVVSLSEGTSAAAGSSVPSGSVSSSASAAASASSSSLGSSVAGLASGLGSLLARPLDAVSSLLSPSDPYLMMRTRMQNKLRDVARQEELAKLQLDALRASLAQIQAQQQTEALKLADPRVAAARVTAIKEEAEVKRGLIVSLNSVHAQLQKTLNTIDVERKNCNEMWKGADRHVSALYTRSTALLGMIAKGESKLEQLAASKDGLADQLRVKVGTQAIVHAQQQDSIWPALAKINVELNHALHSFRHAHTALESVLRVSLRRADYAAHRAKMAAMGIDLPAVEDTHSQHISMPDMPDEKGDIAAGPQRARNKAINGDDEWASSAAVEGLKKLLAPVHTNVLRSPFLSHRPSPFPCVAHVSVEMQVPAAFGHGGGGGNSGSAINPGAFSSSLLPPVPVLPETQSTHGLMDVSACSMLYESDVPLGENVPASAPVASASAAYAAAASSAADDDPPRPIVSTLRRLCIDLSRDLLDVYAMDRYGHREDQQSDDDDDDDDDEDATAADGAAQTTTEATALPPAPHSPESSHASIAAPPRESMSPAHASSAASHPSSASPSTAPCSLISSASLLLTFRPGFRNRFLFNVDTNDSPSTAGPSSSVLSLVSGHSAGASAGPKSAESALSSLTSGLAGAAPQHLVKLTADARTIRRIYLTLRIYLEDRRAAEITATTHKNAEHTQQQQQGHGARGKPVAPSSPQTTHPKPPSVPTAAPTVAASSASSSSSSSAAARSPVSRSSLKPSPSPPLYQRDTSVYVEGESALVHDAHLRTLVKACPSRYSLNVWGLVYSTARHGISRTRFFDVVSQYPAAIVIIKELKNQTVFGGFASTPFTPNSKQGYYGSGECYVFRIHHATATESVGPTGAPDGSGTVQVFRWRGADDYFMITGDSYIAMGGGGAYAWMLDSEFRHGTSGPCSTFESPQLTKTHAFELNELEVWAPTRDFDIDEDEFLNR